ncbi:chromate transporter [uncultured Clostridium sp.]|uniref:chromate transporter n=1 Tax=uncultured Clostridium sp. TaxID=59620 RepID=UPI00262727D7|nr:chromate transporter [uncultured Clostridium sp.]
MKKIFQLFLIFFKVSMITHGGGYAMIGVIQDEVVNNKKLMDDEEYMEIIGLCQTFPGPLAIGSSLFVGFRLGGPLGAAACLLGALLPPFVMIYILASFFMNFNHNIYVQYILDGIDALVPMIVLMAVVNFSKKMPKNLHNIIVAIIALVALTVFHINPAFVIIVSAIYGIVVFGIFKREVPK